MTNLSSIVEVLAQQALGGQQQSGQSGLGGILGSVLGQVTGGQQQNQGGFGGILGSVLGGLGGGQQSQTGGLNAQGLLVAVVPLILSWIQQNGGLQGALAKLQGAGLGGQVQSWVDPNQNNGEAVASQIQGLFNSQEVEQVAQQANVPTDQVYGAISSVLPQIIDSLTPNGEDTDHQEANSDIQNVLGMVSGFLK